MSRPASSSAVDDREFPTYRAQDFLPSFLLGWVLGAVLTFAVRQVGLKFLDDPCRGHTVLALAIPLLLGPGGLAFTAFNWRFPRRAALGLGLVVASFLPGLFLGARDIGELRTIGCAGGYVVISTPGTKSVSSVEIPQGQTKELIARIGGFNKQTHPDPFTLQAASSTPKISVKLGKTQVYAGESFPLQVTVAPNAPINTFTVGVQATQMHGGKSVGANTSIDVNVRP